VNKAISIAEYKKNYWIKNLENKIDYIEATLDKREPEKFEAGLTLLHNELAHELPEIRKIPISNIQKIEFQALDQLNPIHINPEVIKQTREFLKVLKKVYIRIYNNANDNKDNLIRELQKTQSDKNNFLELKRTYHNEKLTEFVENNNELVRIIEYRGRLYQKIDPIYLDPEPGFLKAHFYAPRKMVFGNYYSTFAINTLIIWGFSLVLYLLLYFRLLKRLLDWMEQLSSRLSNQS